VSTRQHTSYDWELTRWFCSVWDDVYGFDYSCIKEIALREPLVDTVDLKAVVTNPCKIAVSDTVVDCVRTRTDWSSSQTFDLLTVTKADLNFVADFKLVATRNDCACQSFPCPSTWRLTNEMYRHPRIPRMVRRLFPRVPQARIILHWASRQVHTLEACVPLSSSSTPPLTFPSLAQKPSSTSAT
jgi:hypothetical protein